MSVYALQEAVRKAEQVEIKTRHLFCNGCYAREITIPAGVVIVGAKHKTEHFHVISAGRCIINMGDEHKEYAAPYTGITAVGTKRAIYAIEETVFTTFHPTTETNIETIESQIIESEGLKIANNPRGKLWRG